MGRSVQEQRVRRARVLGAAFGVAGVVAIGLGWSARQACSDCQMPYLISGGIAGLAMILMGAGMFVRAHVTDERRALEAKLGGFTAALVAGSNGARKRVLEHAVVVELSVYHRPGCRLVAAMNDLEELNEPEARARGLEPCRICVGARAHRRAERPEPAEHT